MTASLAVSPTNFHISLNAADLARSVEFFTKLFGAPPAKFRDDYAKFEVTNPPLTLSLEPVAPSAGTGALNHVGFRLQSAEELVALQRRLEMAGLHSEREEGVECCYAKQTKFWLHDPDGNLWEFYMLVGDIDHRGAGQTRTALPAADSASRRNAADLPPILCDTPAPKDTWSHRIGQPFPLPLPFGEGSQREIRLQGTFNADVDSASTDDMLAEAARVLAPGGKLAIHNLTGNRPFDGELSLPGPASVVKHVPVDGDLLHSLESAGFTGIQLKTFRSAPCFQIDGVQMRETRIEAVKSDVKTGEPIVTVVYKGPFREVTLDGGRTLVRGERGELPESVWKQLAASDSAEQFVAMQTPLGEFACT